MPILLDSFFGTLAFSYTNARLMAFKAPMLYSNKRVPEKILFPFPKA